MDFSEKFLHGSYAIAIMILASSSLGFLVSFLQLDPLYTFVVMGGMGIIYLIIGLFKFDQGLSLGLTLAGIASLIRGSWSYWDKVSDVFKFSLAAVMLFIVLYAIYRLSKPKKG